MATFSIIFKDSEIKCSIHFQECRRQISKIIVKKKDTPKKYGNIIVAVIANILGIKLNQLNTRITGAIRLNNRSNALRNVAEVDKFDVNTCRTYTILIHTF